MYELRGVGKTRAMNSETMPIRTPRIDLNRNSRHWHCGETRLARRGQCGGTKVQTIAQSTSASSNISNQDINNPSVHVAGTATPTSTHSKRYRADGQEQINVFTWPGRAPTAQNICTLKTANRNTAIEITATCNAQECEPIRRTTFST